MMEEVKYLNRWREISYSWVGGFNFLTWSIDLKICIQNIQRTPETQQWENEQPDFKMCEVSEQTSHQTWYTDER